MKNKKLVLIGKIKLLSPTLIGCGEDNHTDMDVLRDGEGCPFIPATSFIGVLRHFIKPKENRHTEQLKRFWGYAEEKKGRQSAVSCSDLTLCNNDKYDVVIRDGVKISSKTGIAETGSKYDYEVIEPGTEFKLYIEIHIQESKDEEPNNKFLGFSKSMLKTICKALTENKIYIGAKTNNGFGKLELVNHKVYEFDFTNNKADVISWLNRGKRDFSSKTPLILDNGIKTFELKGEQFRIEATFNLKNSLIIRSYPSSPLMPDAVHIKSNDESVIPGTSLKGAIRSRAERILNTLNKPMDILTDLFGDVDKGSDRKLKGMKGRIRIDEVILPRFVAETQARIKIDRFTGGTVGSALFETMPLYNKRFNGIDYRSKPVKNVTITIRNYKPHEAGLILLVLKDLWTGDLAVGGDKAIGRGVFEGVEADIRWNDQTVSLKKENLSDLSNLQEFVDSLKNHEEAGNGGK